ncbi:hypothetical protein [Aliikangiella sp. IMCC44359]|uniref:hypothetical protein n=1 Tax=Aliikangiella sp. IMCC44359 TaxID=3459125 RepID=UPI00403B01E6
MIPYKLPEEKATILHYVKLLNDDTTKAIIERDELRNKEEAIHLANFFWKMVNASNNEDKVSGDNSEYILEKIIITFMTYFRSSGYENEWEEVSDNN